MRDMRIGFIGAGAMAEAIIAGLLAHGGSDNYRLKAFDVDQARQRYIKEKFGITILRDNKELVEEVDVILLAIKPQVADHVLDEIQGLPRPEQLFISIVTGLTIARLEGAFPGVPVVRVVPNTPALIGRGVSVLAGGTSVRREHLDIAEQLFRAVGGVITLNEEMLDAVTALSGSGPAYCYLFLEALIDAGVRVGLPRDVSRKLVLETAAGATAMAQQSGVHLAELKDKVTSPGGTTIAALQVLEAWGWRGALMNAVVAAWKRARELGGGEAKGSVAGRKPPQDEA